MARTLDTNFIEEINNILPCEEARQMIHAIEHEAPTVAIRLNELKADNQQSCQLQKVPWCQYGVYLEKRPQFTFDPNFHAGSYYVQDASSMFIYHVIKCISNQPVKYLDLCAAPGGKTTTALQALPSNSIVVANEIMPQRAQILRENIIKWGHDNCMVTCDAPKTLGALTNEFDIIAADVPCSGEGMFRKDDEAIAQWSPALVKQCANRQRAIIADVWNALKPGGFLIYSTCTYNIHENEEIIDYIIDELGASVVEIPTDKSWNIYDAIDRDYPCYRFLPHKIKGEGLFMCVLKKNTSIINSKNFEKKKSKKTNAPIPTEVKLWVNQNYELSMDSETISAMPKTIKEKLQNNTDKLHILKHLGLNIGNAKGKKIIPSHELAMSPLASGDFFPKYAVNYPTAISYLRGESITIDAPRGFVIISYNGTTLGFVNNLGNRANNLYPKAWRIMSSHAPKESPSFY